MSVMVSETLKRKLKQINVNPNNAEIQLRERAMAQVNAYINLVNTRVTSTVCVDDEASLHIFDAVNRMAVMTQADNSLDN